MFRKIKLFYRSIYGYVRNYHKLDLLLKRVTDDAKNPKINIAQLQINFNNKIQFIDNLSEVEFQVYSQNGEDGILQYLIKKINIPNKTFIEFGVENYLESNTRFLFINNNWTGYVIDGSKENVNFIEHNIASYGELYFECAFITKENINELVKKPKFHREVGVLSIDIDGNDYWVWQAIDCLSPIIIIVEYNSIFGYNTYWSVPYDPKFVRNSKHSSQLYYGASLMALCSLAEEKGYIFIGSNSRGNNAFFIRNDKMGDFIKPKTVKEGYVKSKFREARDQDGWITGESRIQTINGMEVINVKTGECIKIDPAEVYYE